MGVHILRYLKEELVWATNKWLGLFVIYNSYTTKELRVKLFYVNIVSIVHNKREGEYPILTITCTNALHKVCAISHRVLSFCINTIRVTKI